MKLVTIYEIEKKEKRPDVKLDTNYKCEISYT